MDIWITSERPNLFFSVIANGYSLLFQSTPVGIRLNNNKFKDSFEEAIEELLLMHQQGREKLNPLYVVNLLIVSVQANSNKRLILDLRHVNKY